MRNTNDRKVMAEGRYLRMVDKGGWECVERVKCSDVVGIVAITDDGKLLLIEQYRPPLECSVIELPAGLVGDVAGQEGEDLAEAARRELEEETGYRAGSMVALGKGAISAGMSNEIITCFLATGLAKVGDGGGDHTEDIRVFEVPLAEVDAWLRKRVSLGDALDVKVYSGLYLAGIFPGGQQVPS